MNLPTRLTITGTARAMYFLQIVGNRCADMKSGRFWWLAVAFMVTAFLAASGASAQDVRGMLREQLTAAADPSYQKLARDFEIVDAATGETGFTTFVPEPGRMYFVYGLCDANCTNIDLELSDSNDGWWTEHDRRSDARPVVAIPSSDKSREIGIILDMVACETETCAMGIGIYSVELK
ncbi:hypothetical protein K1X12_09650 [Hyphomonas sp. WL0036]|uniref:hypothetical protein n=1 Tax=Hyphomonas sediminis TaxID=2866160 RepID=UPI001C81ED58|nr:hypothetical protein [Hyphomonas sediminis]MBY9067163.1 hypothetical protein [Hyphomonas sediminis]